MKEFKIQFEMNTHEQSAGQCRRNFVFFFDCNRYYYIIGQQAVVSSQQQRSGFARLHVFNLIAVSLNYERNRKIIKSVLV